jgi:hypothetical protein
MIHTDEDDEFERIAHEAKIKGQPYYFEGHPTDPDKAIFRKPQRDFGWKELTLAEVEEAYDQHAKHQVEDMGVSGWVDFAASIEAKLRSKNNG